jgi:hypothetical protein
VYVSFPYDQPSWLRDNLAGFRYSVREERIVEDNSSHLERSDGGNPFSNSKLRTSLSVRREGFFSRSPERIWTHYLKFCWACAILVVIEVDSRSIGMFCSSSGGSTGCRDNASASWWNFPPRWTISRSKSCNWRLQRAKRPAKSFFFRSQQTVIRQDADPTTQNIGFTYYFPTAKPKPL